jgi:DNA-binding PadR family transcriptional regulator
MTLVLHNQPTTENNIMATKRAKPDTDETPQDTETSEKKVRRQMGDKGWLAEQVNKVILRWNDEDQATREQLTPHRIAKQITNREDETPSTGAVTAALVRMEKYGYITLGKEPLQVKRITAAGVKNGLGGCQEAYRERLLREKAKEREVVQAAKPAKERKPRAKKDKATADA